MRPDKGASSVRVAYVRSLYVRLTRVRSRELGWPWPGVRRTNAHQRCRRSRAAVARYCCSYWCGPSKLPTEGIILLLQLFWVLRTKKVLEPSCRILGEIIIVCRIPAFKDMTIM